MYNTLDSMGNAVMKKQAVTATSEILLKFTMKMRDTDTDTEFIEHTCG